MQLEDFLKDHPSILKEINKHPLHVYYCTQCHDVVIEEKDPRYDDEDPQHQSKQRLNHARKGHALREVLEGMFVFKGRLLIGVE